MATRKSSSKAKPAPKSAVERSEDFDAVKDMCNTLADTISALDRIRRLVALTAGQLEDENLDGQIFAEHAEELCARYGRRLDSLFSELHPDGVRVGTFDDECFNVEGRIGNG
jgi:hypothetical protein